jgi:thiamine-phosphate pyrophosphorylase
MSSKFLAALQNTRLYPITDRHVSGLSHAEQVSVLGDGGARVIQLREKHLSSREFYSEAEAALRVARERKIKVIINDRVDIALALGADGVHLGQHDLTPVAARRLLGPDLIIGVSTHDPEQARETALLPVDYVAIGPIFHTSTKREADTPIGLEGLSRVRGVTNLPLVAIGGITSQNSPDVLGAGADALALIAEIWSGGQNPAKTRELLYSAS